MTIVIGHQTKMGMGKKRGEMEVMLWWNRIVLMRKKKKKKKYKTYQDKLAAAGIPLLTRVKSKLKVKKVDRSALTFGPLNQYDTHFD